jgi:hypothetical protein
VANRGDRRGADAPQFYLTDAARESRMRLLGFERIELDPGEERRVTSPPIHGCSRATSWPDALAPALPQARDAVLGDGIAWWRARDPDAPFNAGTRVLAALAA